MSLDQLLQVPEKELLEIILFQTPKFGDKLLGSDKDFWRQRYQTLYAVAQTAPFKVIETGEKLMGFKKNFRENMFPTQIRISGSFILVQAGERTLFIFDREKKNLLGYYSTPTTPLGGHHHLPPIADFKSDGNNIILSFMMDDVFVRLPVDQLGGSDIFSYTREVDGEKIDNYLREYLPSSFITAFEVQLRDATTVFDVHEQSKKVVFGAKHKVLLRSNIEASDETEITTYDGHVYSCFFHGDFIISSSVNEIRIHTMEGVPKKVYKAKQGESFGTQCICDGTYLLVLVRTKEVIRVWRLWSDEFKDILSNVPRTAHIELSNGILAYRNSAELLLVDLRTEYKVSMSYGLGDADYRQYKLNHSMWFENGVLTLTTKTDVLSFQIVAIANGKIVCVSCNQRESIYECCAIGKYCSEKCQRKDWVKTHMYHH